IVQAGNCSYLEMDHLVRNNIFEFGVFDFCDSVGLDTMLTSIRNYTRGYPHKDYYSGFITTLSELVSSGRLGIKSQEGFFKYPIDVTPVEEPLNTSEIVEHLLQTWLSASKRFTALVHLPIDDANHAIREYFNIEKGPFE
ncbi:MAG: 3-hydroxyacyl-CoA dehydrogenase family protein, partial [Bacteroidales bacterium]|nr:3-hydroxyacyl-CoA dehydrogenase family protein [Bacteroidales bacterium]